MTAPHGTSYIPDRSIRRRHRIQVSPIGHNASNSLNKTTAGTSQQHQVPDLTAQEDTTHHKPLDNWDIATSPLPPSTSSTGAPNQFSHIWTTSNLHPPGRHVTQTVSSSSQYAESTHHLCTAFGSLSLSECPTPPNLSLVNIAAYTMTRALAWHNS